MFSPFSAPSFDSLHFFALLTPVPQFSSPHTTPQSSPALFVCLQPGCFLFPASSFWSRSSVFIYSISKRSPLPESSLNFPHQNALSRPSKLPSAADHLCLLCCDHHLLVSSTLSHGPYLVSVSTVHCLAPCSY